MKPAFLPTKTSLEVTGSGIDKFISILHYAEVAFCFFGAGCRADVVGGEFCFDDGFGVAFEDADYLGEVAVFGLFIFRVSGWLGGW